MNDELDHRPQTLDTPRSIGDERPGIASATADNTSDHTFNNRRINFNENVGRNVQSFNMIPS